LGAAGHHRLMVGRLQRVSAKSARANTETFAEKK
jgi:hypothetical protein